MVRSNWTKAVVLGLACAGLAYGQTSPTPTPAAPTAASAPSPKAKQQPRVPTMPGDRVITIQEAGRPPQKCKLLKMWREKDGSMAYLVQALDTAEMLSIVESRTQATTTPTSSPVRAVATRIFHWGVGNKVPPAGTPMPPEDAVAVSPAPANQGPSPKFQRMATKAPTVTTDIKVYCSSSHVGMKVSGWK